MPYFITDSSPDCSGWATVKEDGEVIGCHTTKQDAIDQMVAVSIAEEIEPGGERDLEKREVNLTPPAYMRAAARRGLELNRQGFGGDGLTDKTKQEARDMKPLKKFSGFFMDFPVFSLASFFFFLKRFCQYHS
jgi:hypothetical protein